MKSTTKPGVSPPQGFPPKYRLFVLAISLALAIAFFAVIILAPSVLWTSNSDWSTGTFTNVTNITGDLMLNNTIVNGTQTIYSWYYNGWSYRKAVVVNGSTSLQNDYQINLSINSTGMGPNFNWSSYGNDTRFTWLNKSSGLEQNISFWIENWSSSSQTNGNASLWIKVPNITASTVANTTLYMYYGNPSATSTSNYESTSSGTDGSLTVSTTNYVVNNYTYLTGNEGAGDNVIAVNSGTAFANGDEILIIQMQNGTGGGTAGLYEFRRIASGGGTATLTLDTGLINSYTSGIFDTTSASSTQVVRVPQYTTVTVNSGGSITASAWNGYTGGIVAFRVAGTITVNSGGSINTIGAGYRGGPYVTGDPSGCNYRKSGESYPGLGASGNAANGGGGAGSVTAWGTSDTAGGGGGGYGTVGTTGQAGSCSGAVGGNTYGITDLSKLFPGSGGGVSWDPGSGQPPHGGGIIFMAAKNISVSGTILSKGNGGNTGNCAIGRQGEGGGSGGSIYLKADSLTVGTSIVNASGGTGGLAGCQAGGAGGAGRIRLDYTTLSGTTDPSAYTSSWNPSIIRKYASPEPSALTVGAEQAVSSKGTYLSNTTATVGTISSITASWNASDTWTRRANITINNSAANQTNFQVFVNVSYNNAMRSDYGDLRFFWLNGTAQQKIPHWIENYTSSFANVWMKVPSVGNLSNETVYMYYGNPSASYDNSLGGNSTFIQFHGYDTGAYDDAYVVSPPNIQYIAKLRENGGDGGTKFGLKSSGAFLSGSTLNFETTGTTNMYRIVCNSGTCSYDSKSNTHTNNNDINVKATLTATQATFYVNGVELNTPPLATNLPTAPMGLGSTVYSGTPDRIIYYAFAAKYSSSEPNASILSTTTGDYRGLDGQNFTVELTADGSTWLQAANNTQYSSGFGSGSTLRYRINFTTDNTSRTAIVSDINITYTAGQPLWSANATSIASPQPYGANNYGFQVNWTGVANASFQLGRPGGTLTNYTTITTPATQNNSAAGPNVWYINFTQDQLGRAGTYNFTWFGIDTGGAQNKSDMVSYIISQAPTLARLFLNGTEANRNYNISQTANFTVTLNISGKTVYLDTNLSSWSAASGTTPLYNYTQMQSAGIFNITGYFIGNENYSASSATYYANISAVIANITLNLALHLGAVFADDSLQNGNNYNCIQDGSGWFGLTAESPQQAQTGNLTNGYNLNVSFASSGKAYIAEGRGSCSSFGRSANAAQLKQFLSPLAAFSYAKTNLIQLILQFNGTDITSDAHWGKGTYLVSTANQGYNETSGKQNLGVKVVK